LHLAASAALFSTAIAGLIYLILTPLFGALSDRIGRKPLLYASFVGTTVLGYPLFSLLVTWHSVGGLLLVQAIATLCLTCNAGVACAVLAELFPTRIRYTALSIGYGLSVAIFGGFAALIATALIRMTGDPLAPAYYVVAGGVASLVATVFMNEGAKRALPE
jgi:MHS family proline/betaine transporter-like MFS transporter